MLNGACRGSIMQILRTLFGNKTKKQGDDTQAHALYQEITQLEEKQQADPENIKNQQELLIKYTQAASVYSQSESYKDQVDEIFEKINNLRNSARRNF